MISWLIVQSIGWQYRLLTMHTRWQGHLDVALECNEEIGQVGEIWKILEEINGATIPLEEENPEL